MKTIFDKIKEAREIINKQKNRNLISSVVFELAQKMGMNLLMNGEWFDCNRCGAIISRSKAQCMMGGAKGDIPDVCYEWGAVCLNCYQIVEKKTFGEIKESKHE